MLTLTFLFKSTFFPIHNKYEDWWFSSSEARSTRRARKLYFGAAVSSELYSKLSSDWGPLAVRRHDLPLWLSILNSKLFKERKRTWRQRKWLTGQTDFYSNTFYFEFLDLFVDSTLARGAFPYNIILFSPKQWFCCVQYMLSKFLFSNGGSLKQKRRPWGHFFASWEQEKRLTRWLTFETKLQPLQEVGSTDVQSSLARHNEVRVWEKRERVRVSVFVRERVWVWESES